MYNSSKILKIKEVVYQDLVERDECIDCVAEFNCYNIV